MELLNQSGNDAKRTSPNTEIRFDQTNNVRSADVQSLEAEGSSRRKNLQILFELRDGEASDTTVRLNVRIIDTDAKSNGRLIVRGYGYNHFTPDSENNTQNLTEV